MNKVDEHTQSDGRLSHNRPNPFAVRAARIRHRVRLGVRSSAIAEISESPSMPNVGDQRRRTGGNNYGIKAAIRKARLMIINVQSFICQKIGSFKRSNQAIRLIECKRTLEQGSFTSQLDGATRRSVHGNPSGQEIIFRKRIL